MSKRHIVIALLLSFIMLTCAAWGKEKPAREVLYVTQTSSIELGGLTIYSWPRVTAKFREAVQGRKKTRIFLVNEASDRDTNCRIDIRLTAYWYPSYNFGVAKLVWYIEYEESFADVKFMDRITSGWSEIKTDNARGMWEHMLKEGDKEGLRARRALLKICQPSK